MGQAMLASPGSALPPCLVHKSTSTPPWQLVYREQPWLSSGEGAPVHPSSWPQVVKVFLAPKKVIPMPGTRLVAPPS